jgi:hypothetical protein
VVGTGFAHYHCAIRRVAVVMGKAAGAVAVAVEVGLADAA